VCSDVLSYVKAKNLQPVTETVELPAKLSPAKPPTPSPAAPPPPVKHAVAPPSDTDVTDIELTNMRSVIASRLSMSKVRAS